VAAAIGFAAVLVVFAFSGTYILVPLLIGLSIRARAVRL
jgi:hypothetical protein